MGSRPIDEMIGGPPVASGFARDMLLTVCVSFTAVLYLLLLFGGMVAVNGTHRLPDALAPLINVRSGAEGDKQTPNVTK